MAPTRKNNEQSHIQPIDGAIVINDVQPVTDHFPHRASALVISLSEKLVQFLAARFIESRVETNPALLEIRPGARQVPVMAQTPPPYAAVQARRVLGVQIARACWVAVTLLVILAWLQAIMPVSAAITIKFPPTASVQVALGQVVAANAGDICSVFIFGASAVAKADLTCKIDSAQRT